MGVSSAIAWSAGLIALSLVSSAVVPVAVAVVVGSAVTLGLNVIDDEYQITEKLISLLESAQQEFVAKARETGVGLWDLGAMFHDGMLDKGKVVEMKKLSDYKRDNFSSFYMGWY